MEISTNFCFKKFEGDLNLEATALEKYNQNYENAVNLDKNFKICLDTNLFLNYYDMTTNSQEEFLKFLEAKKDQLIVFKQISIEFGRNRKSKILSQSKKLEDLEKKFNDAKNQIKSLANISDLNSIIKDPIVKFNHNAVHQKINTINENLKKTIESFLTKQKIEDQIENCLIEILESNDKKKKAKPADTSYDDLLKSIAQLEQIDNLSEEEIKFIDDLYEKLKENYSYINNKGQETFNRENVFPGAGDSKKADDNSQKIKTGKINGDCAGDLIIYHHILKYMKTHQKDVIFVTADKRKHDWISNDGKPIESYILNCFKLTDQILYVLKDDKIVNTDQSSPTDDSENEISRPENSSLKSAHMDNSVENNYAEQLGGIGLEHLNLVGETKLDSLSDSIIKKHMFQVDRPTYLKIDERNLLYQLKKSENWKKLYGKGFVGLRSFVVNYLGKFGYDFESSFAKIDELEKKGFVEKSRHEPTPESGYSPVETISLTDAGKSYLETLQSHRENL